MAILDRFEPAYVPWTPSASGLGIGAREGEKYVGRHRRASGRTFSLTRFFHLARHRRR